MLPGAARRPSSVQSPWARHLGYALRMGVLLNSIEIEGFKSIAKAHVELKRLNVLIGANGSGKSNFVGVFGLLRRIVDEPELGLHPYAITFVANLFRSVTAEAPVQIIAATQSTAFVNQLQPEELVVVDRGEEGSVFKRPTDAEVAAWLDGYGLGDPWEKNVIGGRPR